MLEVSKVYRELSIQSNVTHVKGVKSSSIYTIRTVLLCLLKVSKEHTHVFTHNFLLIFNRFSIRKKFWKAET